MSGPNQVSGNRSISSISENSKTPSLGAFTGAVAQLQKSGTIRSFPTQPSAVAAGIVSANNSQR